MKFNFSNYKLFRNESKFQKLTFQKIIRKNFRKATYYNNALNENLVKYTFSNYILKLI